MRRLIALLMLMTMTLVSATSVAAAVCQHRNAQEHAAALEGADGRAADDARAEDLAKAHVSNSGTAIDFAAFAFAAFILPEPHALVPAACPRPLRPLPGEMASLSDRAIAPLLEPPAA